MRRKVLRWLAAVVLASLAACGVELARRRSAPSTPGERPDWRYATGRLRGIIAPPVRITPPPSSVHFAHDVGVAVRDGTILRVNVFRPEGEGRYPVILCAHPYGKDNLPERGRFGYRPPPQYRMLRQPKSVTFSAWTSWRRLIPRTGCRAATWW